MIYIRDDKDVDQSGVRNYRKRSRDVHKSLEMLVLSSKIIVKSNSE